MDDFELACLNSTVTSRNTPIINFEDAFKECGRTPHLLEVINSGHYVFVDSRLCLNHSKYILWDATGKPRLTQYAKAHIRECCLLFDLVPVRVPVPQGPVAKARRFKQTQKSHKQSKVFCFRVPTVYFEPHYSHDNNVDNSDSAHSELIKEYNNNMLAIMKVLPMNFSGTLDALIKWVDMTEDELAEASALSEKTIQRLRNNEPHKVSLETVMQLCIGMKLPPPLSSCLLKASGNNFMMTKLHMMYQFLLGACYYQPIDKCNYYLIMQGFNPLGRQNKK